ncbi:hypothetical protein OPQ81_004577 [Rhizoctonia solani]|nr:hypothetical protein OPQ81_004577 [Rhizoctonia solani]
MSAASSFSPPFPQLPASGGHLSLRTGMNTVLSQQSLHLGGESLDEVQISLDVQTDNLSMDEDRAQIDELEEDPNEGLQHPSEPPSSLQHVDAEYVNNEHGPAQVQLMDHTNGENDITLAFEESVAIEEPTGGPPQADTETNALVSKTDAILQAETLIATTATDNPGFISLEGQEVPELSEGKDFALNVSLSEEEMLPSSQDFVREVEGLSADPSEHQSNEQGLNQPDPQIIESEPVVPPEPVVDSHQDIDAPPLQRMDEDTIPVTTLSKDSIIDGLDGASGATVDESIQPVTTIEPAVQESESIASTEGTPEQVDMEMNIQDTVELEKPASAPVMTDVEHIRILEPTQEDEDEDIIMEQDQIVREEDGEPSIHVNAEAGVDQQPIQIIEEGSTLTVPNESTAPISMLDDAFITPGDTAGPIITVVEQTPGEQSESSAIDAPPEVTMTISATSATTTRISTDPAVADPVASTSFTGDMEMEHIERAAHIQQEQDATAQPGEDETPAALVDEPTATANNTIVTENVSDPTVPKDSDSSLRRAPSPSQSPSQLDPVNPEAGPIDPLVTQEGGTRIPEQTSELAKPQDEISPDQPEATSGTGTVNIETPEWEGFAALDEDAHGSPEPDPSSEPPEYTDVETENFHVNPTGNPNEKPTSASTDKAKQPSNSFTTPAPIRKGKKPKMIMEVVIPVALSKPKVVQETKTTQKRPRGRPKTKSAKAPASSELESLEANSSSPLRQSSSAGTPSSVKSEASEYEPEPVPQMKKSGGKRPRPSGPNKRVIKAVASGPSTSARPVHVARAAKLEVVIPRRRRPSALKRVGRTSTGNNVKFAPALSVTRKRKAESEPEVDEGDTDADADGETDDEYEDVEEEPKVKLEVVISPKPGKRTKATKVKKSPVKRPHRSKDARKTPAKLPSLVSQASRPSPKRRRLRR